MSSLGVNLEKYLIPLKEIVLATQDFNEQYLIGVGASGRVYKGQLSERWQNQIVAIRRLDPHTGQGKHEFYNELQMISRFNHENIIHFIGYCDEDNEMIAVFEYATSGSLDAHLHDQNRRRFLTWAQRLKICIGVARGLEYLHSGLGEDNILYHRDINSGNILLDDKLEAKISDINLSLLVNRNNKALLVHERVVRIQPYLDPIYKESGIANIESDIYSFGMILFEMLTGMLAYIERVMDDDKPQRLINMVRRNYDEGVDNLVDPLIKDQINIRSLLTIKDIAYECISWNLR